MNLHRTAWPRLLAPALLWAGLACAQPAPAPVTPASSVALPALPLPPAAQVMDLLARQPAVLAARAGQDAAAGRQARLQAGTQEWLLKAGTQNRRDNTTGARYTEPELGMERAVRWPGKAQADNALGAREVTLAGLATVDAWHESARGLLKAWFDWQRERGSARQWEAQLGLARQQLQVTQRRVLAGEVARMEQLMAQADVDRTEAALRQARLREQLQAQELQTRYPGIALAPPVPPGPGPSLPDTSASWMARILDDNHEVELAETEAELARLHSQRSALDSRPDPVLGVRMTRERGGQESVLGAYVSLPLPGAARAADARTAVALADAAEQRLLGTRQRVQAMALRVVTQAQDQTAISRQLDAVEAGLRRVADLAARAYSLGEGTLADTLQARRLALDAALQAEAARWDATEAVARVLVDAHQLWASPDHP